MLDWVAAERQAQVLKCCSAAKADSVGLLFADRIGWVATER